jgi:hypothetical protein
MPPGEGLEKCTTFDMTRQFPVDHVRRVSDRDIRRREAPAVYEGKSLR